LILNIVEEVFTYKAQVIENNYLRTAVVMGLFLVGFGLVALLLSPLISRWLQAAYFSGRKRAGYLGEFVVLGIVYAGLFFVYYRIYVHGVESILPDALQNPQPWYKF
jgi:hypothetical protein